MQGFIAISDVSIDGHRNGM